MYIEDTINCLVTVFAVKGKFILKFINEKPT